MIKTFNEAVKYLEQYIPTPQKIHPGELGLTRMRILLDLLDNPQLKYPTIHVGGTSGKGSTSTIIASILAQKYKVGLHTSPHLVKVNERIKTNIKYQISNIKNTNKISNITPTINDISDRDLIRLVNDVKPVVEKMKMGRLGAPSYFEIITAMAFLEFFRQKVDIAVIEVGMGGRYDATNVIKPEVAVLTNVGLDHTEILGDTVEKIAEDKVGIIKPGIKVVSGVRQPSVIKILRSKIKDQRSRLSLLNQDFSYEMKSISEKGSIFNYFGEKIIKNLKLNLLGEFQVENAALAIRAIEEINNPINTLPRRQASNPTNPSTPLRTSIPMNVTMKQWNNETINKEEIREGLISAYIPGRIEIIRKKPLIILDGAHNTDKIRALVKAIRAIFPKKKVCAVVAIKKEKKAKEMLELLLPICSKIILTDYSIKADQGIIESYGSKELFTLINKIQRQQRYASRHSKVVRDMMVIGDTKEAVLEAIREATEKADNDELILVTGSLYLVGEIKKFTNNTNEYTNTHE